MDQLTILASLSSSFAVIIATYVIFDFFNYVSEIQRKRFLEQTSSELDDVLIMLPPDKVLDISLALSGLLSFIVMLIYTLKNSDWSWTGLTVTGIITLICVFPVPRFYLRFLKNKRLNKFNEQLEDALTSMSSSLKAGFSINQAIESIAMEDKPPISVEFKLMVQEVRLGVSLEQALDNLLTRMKSEDFELVAAAIITARQTGGALTETLERLANLIRERMRINLKLRSLTAQGKMQATIIGLMPVFLLYMMNIIAPEMMSPFFSDIRGILLLIFAAIMVLSGFLIIKKIVTIDV
jgi:tight adherence protein B